MKSTLSIIVLLTWLNLAHTQPEYKSDKLGSLSFGYIYNSWENAIKDFHILEIEYVQTKYESGHHYFDISKYAGIEIGLNTNKFTIGPKFGTTINLWGIIFGAEIVTYTDFNEATLRIAPVIGFGNHKYIISLVPQIGILNRDFLPTNQGQLNIAIRLIDLKKEEN